MKNGFCLISFEKIVLDSYFIMVYACLLKTMCCILKVSKYNKHRPSSTSKYKRDAKDKLSDK